MTKKTKLCFAHRGQFYKGVGKMISFAYRTSGREEDNIVIATNCTTIEKGVRFFCPNSDCNAHMYLCNLGNPNIKPYFRATLKNHPHIENCRFSKLTFKEENYDEKKFDFEKATKNVMKPSRTGQVQEPRDNITRKSGKKLPPHTIKQIYELAISNSNIDYEYNGTKMWQILADRRSAHIYHKGIFRECMVEAYFAGYKKEKMYIRLKYFLEKNNKNKFHYLKIYFYNYEVFEKAIDLILKTKPDPIIVWGSWKPVDYYFKTTIHSINQLYVP